jgi:cholesterol oxidase
MALQTVPDGQLTQRFNLAREAAEKLGHGERLSKTPLAISFSPEWNYQLPDPINLRHSRTFTNAQGQQQGTCIHLGTCGIGCDVLAKNTLDLNYIPQAEQNGAEVRPLHVVRRIEPDGSGYRVVFDRIETRGLVRGEETAPRVILAAGSLGSTELLLRCRDEYRTLPRLSRLVGRGWSANANVLSMAVYPDRDRVQQGTGPTISAAIDFMDGGSAGVQFVIEDDGFPNLLLNALRAGFDGGNATRVGRSLLSEVENHLRANDAGRKVMVWFGAGMDDAAGELTLERPWLAPWTRALALQWRPEESARVIDAILAMHRRMTDATGGHLTPDVAWTVFRNLLTLHPLGGCRMGRTRDTGVVDHLGQVFDYPNLYVVDGSIVPTALGCNPSHTIAALAERAAAHIR